MYQIKPEAPDEAVSALGTKRDWVQEPSTVLTMDEDWGLAAGEDLRVLRVKTGHFTVTSSLNTRQKADRLLVILSGARGAGKDTDVKRMQFLRRDWDALYKMPILAVSDPATETYWGGEVPRAGLYLGSAAHDLVPELNAMIDKICKELGISTDRVIIMGASAGGTAAMLIAAQRKVARAVAICAPFFTEKFRKIIAAAMEAMGGTTDDWVRMANETPWRTHPMSAIKRAAELGNDVRIVCAQNLQDPPMYNKHFSKMCKFMSINPSAGGVSTDGTMMGLLYDDWEGGHGFESKNFSAPIWRRSLEYFDSGK